MEDISIGANRQPGEASGKDAGQQTQGAAGERNPVYFPDVLETTEDSPVLLGCLLEAAGFSAADAGLSIVRIDGVDIGHGEASQLPGVRVGEGEGCGYVYRRSMDGQLVFSPDMGFTGVTAFNYTVADVFGQTATLVATLSVLPSQPEAEITFADGSQFASVAEGIDAVIIGALNISGIEDGDEPLVLEVFEGDSRLPSQRFVIAGDKLQLSSGVDHEADGAIPLRIVASRNGLQAAAAEFEIEVRSTAADSPRTGVPDMPDFAQGPTLAYSTELSLLEQAGNDQFVFEAAELESIEADWNDSEALDLAAQLPAPGNLDAVPQDVEGKPETVSDSHASPETQPPSGGDDFSNI